MENLVTTDLIISSVANEGHLRINQTEISSRESTRLSQVQGYKPVPDYRPHLPLDENSESVQGVGKPENSQIAYVK